MQVDAIEEGKIITVNEEYAKREGLFILKRHTESKPAEQTNSRSKRFVDEKRPVFDDYRKQLRTSTDPLMKELKENFHWDLLEKRKVKNITRKQLAQSLGVSEVDIKMVENGVLPTRDLVLINKLEKFYGINLRKGSLNYQDSFRDKALEGKEIRRTDYSGKIQKSRESRENADNPIAGADIEIIDLE